MKTDISPTAPLFFSMTYEFLELYLPKQCGRSSHTVESYRDALSLFRRYVLDTLGVSIGKFTFADCTRECCSSPATASAEGANLHIIDSVN